MSEDICEGLQRHMDALDGKNELKVGPCMIRYDYERSMEEIARLRSELEEARAAISRYLDERDAPVKDYALIHLYRKNLRALLSTEKEI